MEMPKRLRRLSKAAMGMQFLCALVQFAVMIVQIRAGHLFFSIMYGLYCCAWSVIAHRSLIRYRSGKW